MSTIEAVHPTDVVRSIFERLNEHDVEGLKQFAAEDEVTDWPVVGRLQGGPAVRNHFAAMFAAIPDFHIDLERLVAEDETVFAHWHMTGRFTGVPFYGIEATGRPLDLRGTDYFTIRGGKVVANFIAYDGMSYAVQAGILPPPGSRMERAMFAAVNLRTRVRRLLRR